MASVTEPQPLSSAGIALINIFPTTSPQDQATTELVHRLRNETLPPVTRATGLQVLTTGLPPFVVDLSDYIGGRLPLFFGAVLLLSFLLLLTVTALSCRSKP